MIRVFVVTAVICFLVLLGGLSVNATDTRPCADDVGKFCKDVTPGGGRIAACLKEHDKDLSPACKARSHEMMKRAKEIHKACADDIDKYCADVKPGKGTMAKCLRENNAQLSPECKAEFGKRRHMRD